MAFACINDVGMLPESFHECPSVPPQYEWLSPRISISGGTGNNEASKNGEEKPDPEKDFVDFEFQLDDPAPMLPADEIFSDGKLVPLQLAAVRVAEADCAAEILFSEPVKSDLYVFSPKAPSCTSRWRELLFLKKAQRSKTERQKSSDPSGSKVSNSISLKHFLHRDHKSSSNDSSLSHPLLRDSDPDLLSISARLSQSSSSSSGPDHEDLPPLSLEPDRPNLFPTSMCRNPPTVRLPKGRTVDSPRLHASGKVIFQGLERSSSSPSTFNGRQRPRPRGMERSYSANIRVKPILNVPVCSLRGKPKSVSVFGFGPLLSPQKKEKAASVPAKTNSSTVSAANGSKAKS
ncbi:hypothetical protein AXF42_Ash014998 [Apostasia shenzhenica]|uniref:Uncharacterized protein n=1 Tax=Apostasia shenzhenica TaxID=1088818 RepID=A0A2I0B2V3_9ASPA|nr:hypothetical protein AXF42_Ash014998 [Apostasia shenzhenica]